MQVLKIFLIFVILGMSLLTIKETKFQSFIQDMEYKKESKIAVYATVVGDKEEKEYSDMYKIKVLNVNGKNYSNTYCLIKLTKQDTQNLKYADLIYFEGTFEKPQDATNFKGFSYKEYLKTINVSGTFKTTYNKIKTLKEENLSMPYLLANKVKKSFERSIRQII